MAIKAAEQSPASRAPQSAAGAGEEALSTWQGRLLPLMVRVVIGLTMFFFVASLGQLIYLHGHIRAQPESMLSAWLSQPGRAEPPTGSQASALELAARLEHDVIARRYHVTSTLLMGQLWIRYLGFVTGMILAMIGAVFILGKLREPASELKAGSHAVNLALTTASPGILLAVVGSGLMMATILTKQEAWVTDAALYLPGRGTVTEAPGRNPVSGQIEALRSLSTGGGADPKTKSDSD